MGYGAGEFLVVGTGNYLRHRRTNGTWSGNLTNLKPNYSAREFRGAWVGSGVIALAATRVYDGLAQYELWTCPVGKSAETGDHWTVHILGGAPYVESAGLYDVHGSAEGELRAVGAGVRPGASPWLDGYMFVRDPAAL